MPPPPRRGRKRAAAPEVGDSQEPVTPVTPDTPPGPGSGPDLQEAMAGAERQGPPPPPSRRTAPKSRPTQADKLQDSLAELLSLPALAYAAAGDQWASTFVAERAPVMAEAWVNLGKENPAVMRVLRKITTTSAWGGVIMATGGTVLPLLIHHDLLPDLGLPLPGGTGEEGSPIVPPPPTGGPPPPGPATPGPAAVGRRPPPPNGHTDMTPPTRPGQPPGVVTVAGTNNQAVNRPD